MDGRAISIVVAVDALYGVGASDGPERAGFASDGSHVIWRLDTPAGRWRGQVGQ